MANSIVCFGKVEKVRSYRGTDNIERFVGTIKGEISIDCVLTEDYSGHDVIVQIDSGKNGIISRVIKVLD